MSGNTKERYIILTELQQQLPLFFQPWWLSAVCGNWDIAIWEEGNAVKAVFPYQIEKKICINLARNPLLTPYLGPFFLEEKETMAAQLDFEEKALTELWKQIPGFDYFQFETVPEFKNFPLIHGQGFSNTAKLTYFIDLEQTKEQLFSKIHARRRNYIRKTEKELTVEIEKEPNIDLLYGWHKHAFSQKKQHYPYSVSFLKKIITIAETHNSSLFLTAKDKSGNPVAMLWTPFDNGKFYHLLGAYDYSKKNNGAMDLLVWTALKKAKELGKKTYDFEGSMDPGIESFFRKFGGERKQYFSFKKNKSMIWKWKLAIFG